MTPSVPGTGRWRWIVFFAVVLALFAALVWSLDVHAQDASTVDAGNQAAEQANSQDATKSLLDGLATSIVSAWENWIKTSGVVTILKGAFAVLGTMAKGYIAGLDKANGSGDIMGRLNVEGALGDPVVVSIVSRTRQLFLGIVQTRAVFAGLLILVVVLVAIVTQVHTLWIAAVTAVV